MQSASLHPDPSGTVLHSNATVHSQEVPDSLQPPLYNLGDVVAVKDNVKMRQQVDDDYGDPQWHWVYSVMFQNNTIKYTENNLELVEAFDWSRPAQKGIVD